MRERATARTADYLVILVPAVVAVVVHLGTLANELVYDDPSAMTLAARPVSELLPRRYGLTGLSIHFDRWLWAGSVPAVHLGNVVLHGFASGLAAALARNLGAGGTAALWCGLLFAVHPVHVEAVASIENRKEILAMIFVAASLLCYRRGRGAAGTAGAVGSLLLAMSAKDVAAVGVVAMAPLSDLLLDGPRSLRKRWPRATALVLAALVATAWYARGALADPETTRLTSRVFPNAAAARATSAAVVPDLARLLVFPRTLAADYPRDVRPGLGDPAAVRGLTLLGAWLLATALCARRARLVSVALVWPLVMYAPLANLVPLSQYPVAERYLYVPSFGICLLAGLGIAALPRALPSRPLRLAAGAAAILLVLAAAARSARRVGEWHDAMTLWQSALRAYPQGSSKIHGEIGLALLESGRASEAIPHFERALAIGPPEAGHVNNLGLALWRVRRVDEAIVQFQRAVAMWPEHQMMRFNLGSALLQAGRVAEARPHLAILARPESWQDVPPTARLALEVQHSSPEALRQSIAAWLAGGAGS